MTPKLKLFNSHFQKIQRRLEAEGKAAASFHHGLNQGQIREAFVREFLEQNVSDFCGVGTGEIIHSDMPFGERRNQIDVVVHNKRYPKISLATGIDLFFIETVSSFIEIKSSLKKEHLRTFAGVSKRIKNLADFPPQRFNPSGMVRNPRPYSLVFSYGGPRKIGTVLNWMKELSGEDDYNLDALRQTAPKDRPFFNNLFIDAVVVLGTGYVYVDSTPFDSPLLNRSDVPRDAIWVSSEEGEVPMLWVLINTLSEVLLWNNFEMGAYLGVVKRRLDD